MTRYLLGVNFKGRVVDTPMEEWQPERIAPAFTVMSPHGTNRTR